ncbi:MAG: lipoprotein-releasing system ATP-binding protein [Planctomycetota bacterium]|jgi:lipoprotein-releasing system ATP-binding protein
MNPTADNGQAGEQVLQEQHVEPASITTPSASTAKHLIRGVGVRKAFKVGDRNLEILHGVDISIAHGEIVALLGASGAGKSTLLHVLGLLDRPTEGQVIIEGVDAWKLSTAARAKLRNQKIGFVFQFYHLLPELSSLENVVLPAMIAESRREFRRNRTEHMERATDMLTRFGLGARLKHRPEQLSGGERQRVALARALFLNPPLLIADEPTGNLDSGTGKKVLELLFEEQARRNITLLLVTHDERLAAQCGRVLHMGDGMIVRDSAIPVPD